MIDIERVVTLDELVERVPEQLIRQAEQNRSESAKENHSTTSRRVQEQDIVTKEPSKAQRIRRFLEENPEVRNKDVVDALAEYQITAADVANVKSIAKRAVQKSTPTHREPRKPLSEPRATTTSVTTAGPAITLPELEAGVAFVKAAGSVTRAKHLLIIIEQIKDCC